jgi:uncharacterized protein DUF4304
MSAQDSFREVLKPIAAFLRTRGFKGSRQDFSLLAPSGNQALVNIQKSTSSTSSLVRFMVNVAVVSRRLWEWYYEEHAGAHKPDVWKAHWWDRLQDPLRRQEKWWEVISSSDSTAIADEVIGLLEQQALPRVFPLLEDEGLVGLWRSGSSPGLTAEQATQYLAVLENSLKSG